MAANSEAPLPPERRSFSQGTTIFKEGEAGDAAFIVESGRVNIVKSLNGRTVVIGSISPWGIFGELAVIDDGPRMGTAVAAADTVCLVIRKESLRFMLDQAPQGLGVIIASMANTLRQAGQDLAAARLTLLEN